MAYKMKRTKGGTDFGEWKPAKVQVNGAKTKAKITPKGEDSFVLPTKDLNNIPSGTWMVQVTEDNEVNGWKPYSGMFRGKVSGFVSKEGEEPAPQSKHVEFVDDNGKKHSYDYLYWLALVEITEGEAEGCVMSAMVRYKFAEMLEEVDGKERRVVGIKGHGKYTDFLEEFLEVTGGATKPMPWSDNILPTLEKRILRADKEFSFVVKNGYINTLLNS